MEIVHDTVPAAFCLRKQEQDTITGHDHWRTDSLQIGFTWSWAPSTLPTDRSLNCKSVKNIYNMLKPTLASVIQWWHFRSLHSTDTRGFISCSEPPGLVLCVILLTDEPLCKMWATLHQDPSQLLFHVAMLFRLFPLLCNYLSSFVWFSKEETDLWTC